MRHPVSSLDNMHPLVECMFVDYANLLRQKYPERIVRNATVYASAIPEFSRLGYIQLVDARAGIPKEIPEFLADRIKRAKRQPIWVPGVNFPDDPRDLRKQMQPSLSDDKIIWRHIPARRPSTWRTN